VHNRVVPGRDEPLSVTWIGHSTVLVEAAGTRLLTDPLLRRRIAHVRRVAGAPPAIGNELEAVLVSHVHYDHLDLPSLRLTRAKRIVAPRGAGRLLERRGLGPVVEVDAGDEVIVGDVVVRATPAVHHARRGLGWEAPALGYLISAPARIYFAGDTQVFEGMRELAPGLELALLPVWGWGPRVGRGHLDPRGAAEALRLLEPRLAVPIHWGTYRRFDLSRDEATLREPAERFARLAAEVAPRVTVRILSPGERLEIGARAEPAAEGPRP
jgi:L-ascorbate metabolism protein UlaG (beta-lactamase superfamily)